MWNSIINEISGMRLFILVSTVGTLIAGLALWILCRQFNWKKGTRKLFGFFYYQRGKDTALCAVCLTKIFLFAAILIGKGQIIYAHMIAFAILQIACMILRATKKELVYHIAMPFVAEGIMLVMHILSSYLTDIIFDWRVFIVVMLLGVLLVFYALIDAALAYRHIVVAGIERYNRLQKEESDEEKESNDSEQQTA